MSADIELRLRRGDFALSAAFSFGAAPGVTALFGPSGAGKSSVILALAGLVRPDAGRIAIAGDLLFDSKHGVDVPARARRIGVVFQDSRLFPHLTVGANLLYGQRRIKGASGQGRFDQVVALFGLGSLLERRPKTLSGGERARVALGRALLMNPRALLLDEPLAALDAARKAEILPYLDRLVREERIPMLYVSHSLDEVARLAERMVVIDRGRVVAEGSLFDITARLDLLSGTHLVPGAVLEARIARHDDNHGLTELQAGREILVVPRIARAVGESVRIRIDAEDVMLALSQPQDISANNVLPATVTAIAEDGPNADVQLAFDGAKLIARITRRSLARMKIAPGQRVFAVVKSVTVGGREHG